MIFISCPLPLKKKKKKMKKKEKTRGVTNKMVGIGSLIQNVKRKFYSLSLLRFVEDSGGGCVLGWGYFWLFSTWLFSSSYPNHEPPLSPWIIALLQPSKSPHDWHLSVWLHWWRIKGFCQTYGSLFTQGAVLSDHCQLKHKRRAFPILHL